MLQALLLALGFFATTLLASTAVPSLPLPLSYTPLVMITGLLTMHRVGAGPGAAWLSFGGLFLEVTHAAPGSFAPLLLSSLVAVLLVERVFATRSVYALLGLGLATGACVFVFNLALGTLAGVFGDAPSTFSSLLAVNAWMLLLLLAGLYAGFVCLVGLRSWTRRTFVVRS